MPSSPISYTRNITFCLSPTNNILEATKEDVYSFCTKKAKPLHFLNIINSSLILIFNYRKYNANNKINTKMIFESVCVKCDFTHSIIFKNRFYAPCIEKYRSMYMRKMILHSCYCRARINTFALVSKYTNIM